MRPWKDFAPPGANLKGERQLLAISAGCIALFSLLIFFPRLFDAIHKLYSSHLGRWVLTPGARMPDFFELLRGCFTAYPLIIVLMLGLAAAHYGSFYGESRSIYVMARLSSPWELHRRCLGIPLLGILLGGLECLLLMGIFALCYRYLPPEECLGRILSAGLGRLF